MKNVTKFSLAVQKELNRNLEIGSLISLIIGSIGLFFYIVLGVVLVTEPQWLDYVLYSSAVLFGFGLVFLISIRKTNRNASIESIENEYEFSEDFFTIDSTKNSEKIATVKTYYNEIYKLKITKNYLFIFPNQYTSYPVSKITFSEEELIGLILKIKNGCKERKNNLNKAN